jgi:general secretion pathway protein E
MKELAESLKLPYLERLPQPNPPRDLKIGDFDRIVGSWGRQYYTIPYDGNEQVVRIATANPLEYHAIDQLAVCYDRPFEVVVTTQEEITKAINAIRTTLMEDRSSALSTTTDENQFNEFEQQLKIDVTDTGDDDAKIINFLNTIIFQANVKRASDVHIESFEESVKVRFRIDGVLYDITKADKAFQAPIISRVKVMAGLNIAEKRLPQDGRIGLKIAGRDVDIRVSTIPTQFGERVVMRLLDKSATVLNLTQLGVSAKNLEIIEKLIQKPNGIFLVTGPTGSGKTTTLYSCLTKINTTDLNILTVEDPIEYQLEGVGQMQVNTKINFTFASGLRAILRQDPDVVMVGEIRDTETAEIAIQASLTGHLVLSTLHTNDSAGAITRLIDMGIEPFLVSSSLLAVLAQRLVRKLCPHCKEPYELTNETFVELGLDPASVPSRIAYRPGSAPCETCHGNRYLGRTGIHELLIIDDEIRSLILQRMDSNTIKQSAQKRGFQTLRLDGAMKILQGETSLEEVVSMTHEELV